MTNVYQIPISPVVDTGSAILPANAGRPLGADGTPFGASVITSTPRSFASISALQAAADDHGVAIIHGRSSVGDGGEGVFRWSGSNLSTEVGNDEVNSSQGDGGIYVAPASDKTGASGAWVRIHEGIIDPHWWGAANNADSTVAIQKAIDADAGTVRMTREGNTYLLTDQGEHPDRPGDRYCLLLNRDNIDFAVGAGVTLKLADGEQTDGNGPVNLIVITGSNRSSIYLRGAGEITGNTAGQTGWSGGYAQNSNGNIVESNSLESPSDIVIEGITLTDHWSNPVRLACQNANHGKRITLRGIQSRNMGEGFELKWWDGVQILDCHYRVDSGITMAGDGIEISNCSEFLIDQCSVTEESGTSAGAAYELFGSKKGIVSNCRSVNWRQATSAGTDVSTSSTVDLVLVTNLLVLGATSVSQILDVAEGVLIYDSVVVKDSSGTLFLIPDDEDSFGPVYFYNVLGDNCGRVLVLSDRKVVWHGGGNINTQDANFACELRQDESGETRNIDFSNLSFSGGPTRDLRFNSAGAGPFTVAGRMSNCDIGTFDANDEVVCTGLDVSGTTGAIVEKTSTADPVADIPFTKILNRASGDLSSFTNGSKNQRIMIRFTGSATVYDQSDVSGVNIFLAGGANFLATAGDRLLLEYDSANDNWYEVSRSVN